MDVGQANSVTSYGLAGHALANLDCRNGTYVIDSDLRMKARQTPGVHGLIPEELPQRLRSIPYKGDKILGVPTVMAQHAKEHVAAFEFVNV